MTLNADTVYFDQSSFNAGMIADSSFQDLKEKNNRRHIRRNIFYAAFALAICAIFVVTCAAVFFKTESVTVEGCGIYDADRIRESSGIALKQNIVFIDKKAVEQSIIRNNPYIKSVDVQLELPSRVVLHCVEETPVYYFELCGQYYILSESMRVLEVADSMAETAMPGVPLIALNTLNVAYAVAGERVVFADSGFDSYAQTMLSAFENSAMADKITLVDFSDKFNIYAVYDHRFRVEFGTADDIGTKITMAYKIIHTFEERDTGVVNVKIDPGYAILDAVHTVR